MFVCVVSKCASPAYTRLFIACPTARRLFYALCNLLLFLWKAIAWVKDVESERRYADSHAIQTNEEPLVMQDRIVHPAWISSTLARVDKDSHCNMYSPFTSSATL